MSQNETQILAQLKQDAKSVVGVQPKHIQVLKAAKMQAPKMVQQDDNLNDTDGNTSTGGGGSTTSGSGTSTNTIDDYEQYLAYLAKQIKNKRVPVTIERFGGFDNKVQFIQRPEQSNPMLFVIEEYRTTSYLGNYGAGKTVQTFTLLPGERTTINVKSYKQLETVRSRAENIMDSFSKSSAEEIENLIETDTQLQDSQNTTTSNSTQTAKDTTASVSLSASASYAGIASISATGSYGVNTSSSNINEATAATMRSSNTNNLSKALNKHTNQSNSNRQVSVNTNSQDTYREGTETTTMRELVNPNVSRVLNFVFRQLVQEYISITCLHDIKIAFCNGHPETFRVVPIEQLDVLLTEVIKGDKIENIRNNIIAQYVTVKNHQDQDVVFLEAATAKNFAQQNISFHRRKPNISGNYTHKNKQYPPVQGVILKVDENVLLTDAVIVDSLLGQGESLDCFNQYAQQAQSHALYLENQKLTLALKALESITDPVQRAEAYAKMFNPPKL